jgi:hypothetical protein
MMYVFTPASLAFAKSDANARAAAFAKAANR